MKMVRKSVALILALILVVLPCFLAVSARAVALDPVTFLYPIWQAFGGANGVSVATAGGDQFTQQAFPSLFDEWQTSRVSNGLQETVQSLSDWVDSIKSYVSVAPSVVSMGILNTALRLESDVVMPLTEFWNWIIKDKLGGSSVDAVDFSSVTGNLGYSSAFTPVAKVGSVKPSWQVMVSSGTSVGGNSAHTREYLVGSLDSIDVYVFYVDNTAGTYLVSASSMANKAFEMWSTDKTDASVTSVLSNIVDSETGLYYDHYGRPEAAGYHASIPSYPSRDAGLAAIKAFLDGDSDSGSITVSPQVGIGALDFPDAADPDYVPSDAVIPWNVPYDQAADRDDYLDRAYDKALDNTLQDVDGVADTPVEGTGTVGNVDQYIAPNLADVFPFCIPFDIYNFLSLLAADPDAPSFTCELAFPAAIGGTKEITIDFDTPTWNQLAMILRTFELLLFIVGLAYITREKMIRS